MRNKKCDVACGLQIPNTYTSDSLLTNAFVEAKNSLFTSQIFLWNNFTLEYEKFQEKGLKSKQSYSNIDSLLNIASLTVTLFKSGYGESASKKTRFEFSPLTPNVIPVLIKNSNATIGDKNSTEKAKNETALKNVLKVVDPSPIFGISFNSLLLREFGKDVSLTLDYKNLKNAVECPENDSAPIKYFRIYLNQKKESIYYHKELGNLFFIGNNYVIYFFRNKFLYREELRINLNSIQYQEILKMLQIDNNIQGTHRRLLLLKQ